MTDRHIEISIESWGRGPGTVDDDLLSDLIAALERHGASGAVTSAGGVTGGVGASFFMIVPEGPAQSHVFSTAVVEGVAAFNGACAEIGLEHDGVARVEAFEPRYMEMEHQREPERYVGVTEIAQMLGVSRQRVMELRKRSDFPEPVAELAAGPVWRVFNLLRFIEEWPRKPGRPKKLESA